MSRTGLARWCRARPSTDRLKLCLLACVASSLAACLVVLPAQAHGVGADDALLVTSGQGARPALLAYLGAKHMVTGLDHGLFLLGMVALLRRWRDVAAYATLFALGHSLTLLAGVLQGWHVNAHAVDALIGLSVVYKAADNLGAFPVLLGWRPPPRAAVLTFGLAHGLGLATQLQALQLPADGLLINLLAFNAGVELGQLAVLAGVLLLLSLWRRGLAIRAVAKANAGPGPVAGTQRASQVAAPGGVGLQLALATGGWVLCFGQLSQWGLAR